MSIEALNASTTIQPLQDQQRGRGEVLSKVADSFGMSTSDLMQQLKGGSSMADIAQSKGITKDQLVQTIASALPQGAGVNADSIAEKIADHKRGDGKGVSGVHGHHHHHHGAKPADATVTDGVPAPAASSTATADGTTHTDTYL
jgi:hypothetical protein